MSKPKILVIEDNSDTRKFLEGVLTQEFEVISAENGIIGLEQARKLIPNLILLDIMLPVLSGYDICNLLRKDERTSRIPIIFLSARNTVANITEGLATGADDYISKPFNYKELIARIKTRLRSSLTETPQALVIGDLKIDPSTRQVSYDGNKVQLTLTEFDILRFLASKTGSISTRDDIMRGVRRDDSKKINDRTIDVHIRALRKKIPALANHILSIYGSGYKYIP